MEVNLPVFNEESYVARQRYVTAIHEAGHAVAAYAVGFGMKKKGIVLHNDTLADRFKGYVCKGTAYTRGPGRRSRDPRKRESYRQRNIVVAFAGPIAEDRVSGEFLFIDGDVQDIALSLRDLLAPKRQFLRKFIANASNIGSYWFNFWDLIFTLVTRIEGSRGKVIEHLINYTELDEDTDEGETLMEANARLFEILWPLAQEALRIVDHRWPSVEKLAGELLKTGSLKRADIEAMIGTSMCEDPNMKELHHPGTVVFQPEYVALLDGDVHCALMLSQLVCWHMRGTRLDSALRVFKDGNWWVAVPWQEWRHKFGFSCAQTRRGLKKLQKAGLIEVTVHDVNGTPTTHVRFPWLAFGKTLPEPPTAAELQHRIAVTEERLASSAASL